MCGRAYRYKAEEEKVRPIEHRGKPEEETYRLCDKLLV